MSAKIKLDEYLRGILPAGETASVAATVQVKGGVKKQLGTTIAGGALASLAVSAATGGNYGLLVVAVPPAAWLVVTPERLLLVERTDLGKGLGRLIFHAPLSAVTLSLKAGLLNEVTVADASDGQPMLRLNLGVKRRLAHDIVAAGGIAGAG